MANDQFDILLWGATGFTGKWVAKHLFDTYAPGQLDWAMAGRNQAKLDQVSHFIGDVQQRIPSFLADSHDIDSLKQLLAKTRVVISTVGPYAYYGSDLVQACAETGTHYVDLTGEVPWMRNMIDRHSASAKDSGAIIVHNCGFDAIPSDIGVHYCQTLAQQKFGRYLKQITYAMVASKGGASGGTIHSMLNIMKQAREDKSVRKILVNPYSINPDPSFKGVDKHDQRAAVFNQDIGKWTAPWVMAAINARVVRRSNALLNFKYGKDFSYHETLITGTGFVGRLKAVSVATGAALFAATAITGVGRKLLARLLPDQGEGPTVDPDNPGFYVVDFYGKTETGDKLRVRLNAKGDPGYGSTSKLLGEAAVCLARGGDGVVQQGGFWTPATAMGEPLLKRLQDHADFKIDTR